jgi:hypothetical protein
VLLAGGESTCAHRTIGEDANSVNSTPINKPTTFDTKSAAVMSDADATTDKKMNDAIASTMGGDEELSEIALGARG